MDIRNLPYAMRHPIPTMQMLKMHAVILRDAVPQEEAFRQFTGGRDLHEFDDEEIPFYEYGAGIRREENRFLYNLVRATAPDNVVETGVWHGASSTAFLSAMKANRKGRLTSIDVNPASGDRIPPDLRDRWRFLAGPSDVLLPRALNDLGAIDIFFHDSDHTYNTMTREYTDAWPRLEEGGLLLTHDVNMSTAMLRFAKRIGKQYVIAATTSNIAGMRKVD